MISELQTIRASRVSSRVRICCKAFSSLKLVELKMNWHRCQDILIDELAVEGLDGCTFDHLYNIVKPLLFTNENSTTISEKHLRCYIWKILLSCPCVELYELPTQLRPPVSPSDLAVENLELNHRGYSSSYHQRKFLTNKSDYKNFDQIKSLDRFHLVVEQNVREFRLIRGQYDTKQLFSKYEYALLECICKTRSKGIATSGNEGLAKIFNINSKSLFYYLKQLIALDIIKKLNLTRQLVGTLKQPMLVMTRFLSRNDYLNSKYTIIDRLKTYLEQCRNHACERNHLKTFLSLGEKSFRSLMRKCKRMNLIEKYNKTMNEYELKRFLSNESEPSTSIPMNNRTRLRSYTFFRLKSLTITKDDDEELASSSDDNEGSDDEEVTGTVEEEETIIDEDDADLLPLSEASSQLDLTSLRLFVDRPFHFQYYHLLEQVKEIGLSQRDLANVCHLSFYSARSEIKSLTKNMKHIALKSVQLNPKGKIMENRIVLKKYLTTVKPTTTTNNVRQQIIAKTPRSKRKKSQVTTSTPTTVESPTSNSPSLIKCEPVDSEHLENEPILSHLLSTTSSETIWRPSTQPVTPKKKSKTRVNPVKRINIKREHRLDLIRSFMEEHPICTLADLRAAIMSNERDEGLTIHMDRKTLDKLVDELDKVHQFLFRFTTRIKQSRTVVCLARRTEEIQPDCEQIQQFQIELAQETIEVPSNNKVTPKENVSIDEIDEDSKATIDHLFNNGLEEEKIAALKKKPLENVTGFGNCYGYVYKFQRCAILHKFLFYLLYGYEGQLENDENQLNSNECEPSLISSDIHIQTLLNSIAESRRYLSTSQGTHWKRFVPPIDTRGRSIPSGCLYLDDVLMCMPVSIFLAVVYVPYKVPGLMELLSHPTKRHILVRDLPAEMRYPLIVRRHYFYRITDVLKYLSTLGLITFVDRPTLSRLEKLNTMIYLHPQASLINTINQTNNSNGPIDQMSNYPRQIYQFTSMNNVNRFWFDLIEISLNTYRVKIFSRKQERSHMTELLKQAIKPIHLEQIQSLKTPLGKSNGPAGFDYDLYLFLRKSWKLPYNNKRVLKLLNREANQCCIPVCELRVPIDVALKRSYTRHLAQKRQQHIRKRTQNSSSTPFDTSLNNTSSPISKTKRTTLPLTIKPVEGIEYYGHLSRYIIPFDLLNQLSFIDRRKKYLFQSIRERNKHILQRFNEILQHKPNEHPSDDDEPMNSPALRVRWSPMEERVISLINAALAFYLPRRQNDFQSDSNNVGSRRPAAFLPFSKEFFRACLIRVLPRSARSKTPQNVVRKIKNDMTQTNRLSQLEHLILLCSTDSYLLTFRNEARRYLKQRFRSNEHFFFLLFERIYLKFQNFIRTGFLHCVPQGTIEYLPLTNEDLTRQFRIIGKPTNSSSIIEHPESTKSILSSTISMAAHSSLLSNERSGTTKAFILHYIFSQYPESLLNEIVYRLMNTDAVITLTKSNDIQRKISNEASTFLAGRAYHINQRYIYRWYTFMPSSVLHETSTWIKEKIFGKHDRRISIDVDEQNRVAIAATFVTYFDNPMFDIDIALPKTLDNEPEMRIDEADRSITDDDDDEDEDEDDENNDREHQRVFEQVLQSARRIDQTRYEIRPKRENSSDENLNHTKRLKVTTADASKYSCVECGKTFLNRTSLVRHRHRQHDQQRQIKSSKNSLRPASSSTTNPLGRGRHATDTSSLSCCSIEFRLLSQFHDEYNRPTIDQLMKQYPFYSAVYEQDQSIDQSDESHIIQQTILHANEFGLTFFQLFEKLQHQMTFVELVTKLNEYLINGSIIAAGCRTRIFVHRKYARSWLIYSIRFRQHDNNNNLESLLTSALVESSSIDADSFNVKSTDHALINEQFERIVFVPRPWKCTDGTINYPVLQRMMESLLLYLIDHPGVDLDHLYEHYKCVLQPVAIDDCLELFQQMNCLETVRVRRSVSTSIDLYSTEDFDDQPIEQTIEPQTDLEHVFVKMNFDYRQMTSFCFPTYDCLAKFPQAFPSRLISEQSRSMDRMPFPNSS